MKPIRQERKKNNQTNSRVNNHKTKTVSGFKRSQLFWSAHDNHAIWKTEGLTKVPSIEMMIRANDFLRMHVQHWYH
jgi:hypothetical protein